MTPMRAASEAPVPNDLNAIVMLVRCPVDHGPLELDERGRFLRNPRLNVTYPVVRGVPDLRLPQDRELEARAKGKAASRKAAATRAARQPQAPDAS